MQVYRIARMEIAVEARFDATKEYLKDYLSNSADYELSVCITDEMLEHERKLNREIHGSEPSDTLCEIVAILRVICDYIVRRGGFFLHCSCLRIDGAAVIFTAPSGTGKSTHAALWRRHFGDRVTMINDDKPLVREESGGFVIYGTPWNGKHRIGSNISAPIKAMLFLEQAKENYTKPLEPIAALSLLLQQTVRPTDPGEMSLLLDMLGRLIETVPMIRLGCNISDEAVVTAYDAVRKYLS
jgi:hypothetical protein